MAGGPTHGRRQSSLLFAARDRPSKAAGDLPEQEWLSVRETAEILAIAEHTARKLIDRGELRAVRVDPGYYAVDRNDLARFLTERHDELDRIWSYSSRPSRERGAAARAAVAATYRPGYQPEPPAGRAPRRSPTRVVAGIDVESPDWLLLDQAAELLGVDETELLDRINRGDVPAYELCGVLRLRRADLAGGVGAMS